MFYQEQEKKTLTIVSYNVQLLFDSIDHGDEYSPFTLEEGYSTALYHKRLEALSKALTQDQNFENDIIVLQEVENDRVVSDFIESYLPNRGFTYYVVSEEKSSPIEIAILSRYEIVDAHIHSIPNQRPIVEAVIDVEGEKIRLFALHLRSQRAGFEESEVERVASVKALTSIIENYNKRGLSFPTIIAGDFNESITSYEQNNKEIQTAMIPYDAVLWNDEGIDGSLLVTGAIVNEKNWYSFYLDPSQMNRLRVPGSYYYQGVWESFDQILLSKEFFDVIGLEFERGGIKEAPHLLTDEGIPFRYDTRKDEGYSDHLPVYVILRFS